MAIWDLDNEPAWWDAVHRDVHPTPSTYDEVTWGGISTALAIERVFLVRPGTLFMPECETEEALIGQYTRSLRLARAGRRR